MYIRLKEKYQAWVWNGSREQQEELQRLGIVFTRQVYASDRYDSQRLIFPSGIASIVGPGDVIVRDADGKLSVCPKEFFMDVYEVVD